MSHGMASNGCRKHHFNAARSKDITDVTILAKKHSKGHDWSGSLVIQIPQDWAIYRTQTAMDDRCMRHGEGVKRKTSTLRTRQALSASNKSYLD